MKQHNRSVSRVVYYILMFVIVFALFSLTIPEQFLSRFNLQSMAFQVPEFGILALGMMVAMLTAGIDLSIIANANLAGIMSAICLLKVTELYPNAGSLAIILVTVVVAVISGTIGGLFNGFLISVLGILPILATLGTMKLFEGLATVVTRGRPITGFPVEIQYIANETIGVVPVSFVIFLIVLVMVALFLKKTPLGFKIYMLGSNEEAARYSRLNNRAILLRAYAVSGLMAGIASIIMMSRFNSVKVGYGNSYLLQAVLVVILGGTNPDGGEGDVFNALFAILTLQCIASGFNILGFTDYMRNVIYGSMLIIVLMFTIMVPRIREMVKRKKETVSIS